MPQIALFHPTPSDRPVLHLRSWGWVNARKKAREWPVGAVAYTIMAHPRWGLGEFGDGRVDVLTPQRLREVSLMERLVRARKEGRSGEEVDRLAVEYRALLDARWSEVALGPGVLFADAGKLVLPVQDGDTLCCACSAPDSLAGKCHRAWAAPHLVRAGWEVWLDGMRVVAEAT